MSGHPRWHRFAVVLALAGCASGPTCSLVGCSSQLTLRLPPGVTQAQACVGGVCTSDVVDGALLVPLGRRADGQSAQVTVRVGAASYEGEVALTRTRPNGESCPPVCVNGEGYVEDGRVVSGARP